MKLGLLLVVAGLAAGGAAESRAEIALVSQAPAVVTGSGFVPRERVRVSLTSPVRRERVVRAGARGRFRVQFGVSLRACDTVRISARGNRGSRTWLAVDSVSGCPPTE